MLKKLLLLALMLSAPLSAFGQIAFINTAGADGTNANQTDWGPVDMTGADAFVIALGLDGSVTAPTCTDSEANTYTKIAGANVASAGSAVYLAINATASNSMTFQCTGTAIVASGVVRGFSGVKTASAFDQSNSNNGGSGLTSIQAGSVTPSENNELVVMSVGHGSGSTPDGSAINGGFTDVDHIKLTGGVAWGSLSGYLIQTTAAAANPTASWNTSVDASATIVTIKSAVGGGGGGSGGVPLLLNLGL